jgi:hypothetical protein
MNSAEYAWRGGFQTGRDSVVEQVWAFIRDHGTPVTGKGETTISVDALFAVIDPRRDGT